MCWVCRHDSERSTSLNFELLAFVYFHEIQTDQYIYFVTTRSASYQRRALLDHIFASHFAFN